jgi:class 3 adenylate cyclase
LDPALRIMIGALHCYDGYICSPSVTAFSLSSGPHGPRGSPQRAVYAALRMQEELHCYADRLRAKGGISIEVRVGINTGELLVRSIQTGARTEYTPIVHTANLAARMQTVAPVGSTNASKSTRKLCEGYFNFKPLRATQVKGVSEPVEVYEVLGVGSRPRARNSCPERRAGVADGREWAVVVKVAEAGAGKSRLIQDMRPSD